MENSLKAVFLNAQPILPQSKFLFDQTSNEFFFTVDIQERAIKFYYMFY